jgi:hypothetical protein
VTLTRQQREIANHGTLPQQCRSLIPYGAIGRRCTARVYKAGRCRSHWDGWKGEKLANRENAGRAAITLRYPRRTVEAMRPRLTADERYVVAEAKAEKQRLKVNAAYAFWKVTA